MATGSFPINNCNFVSVSRIQIFHWQDLSQNLIYFTELSYLEVFNDIFMLYLCYSCVFCFCFLLGRQLSWNVSFVHVSRLNKIRLSHL